MNKINPKNLAAIERASKVNRDFFRNNPHPNIFIRPYIQGEIPDMLGVTVPKGSLVKVTQIRPGYRICELILPQEIEKVKKCMTVDKQTLERFLTHLWRGGRYAYYFLLPEHKPFWFDLPDLQPWVNVLHCKDQNVYFNVNALRDLPEYFQYQRGGSNLVSGLNCLFAEFDSKHYGSKLAILNHIEKLRFKPSVVIDSGGGYHSYWLLRNTFVIDDQTREYATQTQRAFAPHVGGDNVKDLARVLRLPGTLNYKYDPPRLVKFVYVNFDTQYDLTTLAADLPSPTARSHTQSQSFDLPKRQRNSTIARFNSMVRIENVLEHYDYIRIGDRFLAPTSKSGIPGVIIGDTLDDEKHFNMSYIELDFCKVWVVPSRYGAGACEGASEYNVTHIQPFTQRTVTPHYSEAVRAASAIPSEYGFLLCQPVAQAAWQ